MTTETSPRSRARHGGAPRGAGPRVASPAFTFTELLVVLALLALLGATLMPALAHTRPNSLTAQCLNNHRQMARAWEMYADDNNGKLASSYPNLGGWAYAWVGGNAADDGTAHSYTWDGTEVAGLQSGTLWPYTTNPGLYHCPADTRRAPQGTTHAGLPILRSIAMNSALCGYVMNTPTGGANPWTPVNTGWPIDPTYPTYLKQSEMRLPNQTFVFLCEDHASIDDGLFLMDAGGTARFYELPSRAHRFGYTLCFADGHAEIYQLKDDASKTWTRGHLGGYNDWRKLLSVTTHPL